MEGDSTIYSNGAVPRRARGRIAIDSLKGGDGGPPPGTALLTNRPSCLQGPGRNAALGFTPRHLAVELARRHSGEDWLESLRARAAKASAIRFQPRASGSP